MTINNNVRTEQERFRTKEPRHNYKKEAVQLRRERQLLEEENRRLGEEMLQLQEQLRRVEAERQQGLIVLQDERNRYQSDRDYWLIDLLRKMGEGRPFILDMLEGLTMPNPTHANTLTVQNVFDELKNWIRDISGERLTRFPDVKTWPEGYIVLASSELTDPQNGFDVGNERPFSTEQEQVKFKIIRRGWRLGKAILHPARISALPKETDT
ncbi:MAG: hypothetical protein JW892_16275 [Anaerolineae bacterium]|nr:hypothetical protein [Anaerolineae bacterium]